MKNITRYYEAFEELQKEGLSPEFRRNYRPIIDWDKSGVCLFDTKHERGHDKRFEFGKRIYFNYEDLGQFITTIMSSQQCDCRYAYDCCCSCNHPDDEGCYIIGRDGTKFYLDLIELLEWEDFSTDIREYRLFTNNWEFESEEDEETASNSSTGTDLSASTHNSFSSVEEPVKPSKLPAKALFEKPRLKATPKK